MEVVAMGLEDKRSKRDVANERLRVGFLGQAGPHLLELCELLASDPGPEARESIGHELRRTADTAQSLGLGQLATVAGVAAEQVRDGGDPSVLRSVAAALRKARGRPLLGSVVIVAEGKQAARLKVQAEAVAEPVRVIEHADALFDGLQVERPSALVLPVERLDLVGRLSEEGFPILVHGEADRWEERLAAVEAGARGFLPSGFQLATLLDLARGYDAAEADPTVEVFVLAEEGPERAALLEAFGTAGMSAIASASPSEIAPALDVVAPDVLVLGSRVGDRDGRVLIRAVRGHGAAGAVPIVVLGDADEPGALRAAGADDVLPAGTSVAEVVARVEAHARRFAAVPTERDRVTGLANRPAVLRRLDRQLSHARRRGEILATALIQIEGLEEARERWGRAAVNAAERALAEQIDAAVRRVDVVGQLGPGVFVAAMSSCGGADARRRMDEIRTRFARRCRADHRLREIGVSFGVADTETKVDRLLQRTEADLLRARVGVL